MKHIHHFHSFSMLERVFKENLCMYISYIDITHVCTVNINK